MSNGVRRRRVRSSRVHRLEDATKWDPDPLRPAVELVAKLVQRLLQQHRRQLEVEVLGGLRHERGRAGRGQVAAEEGCRNGVHPEPRPGLQARAGRGLELLRPQRSLARIAEGAEHAGDIAKREALQAALIEASGRLAFEVDDYEIMTGVQDLA